MTMQKKLFSILIISLLIIVTLNSSLTSVFATTTGTIGTTGYRDYWPAYAQRTFYAEGRFWAFWFDGSATEGGGYEVYSSSADGVVWSSATEINGKWTPSTRTYSVWNEGHYVYNTMIYLDQWNNEYLVFSRGTLFSNGTIVWGTEQTVLTAPNGNIKYDFIQISVDSNGYPWIAYEIYNYADLSSYPFVIKSSTNDGTWQTQSGFPYQLAYEDTTGVGESFYGQAVYPLTSGKMVAFYVLRGVGYAQAWSGTNWLPEATVASIIGGEHGGSWQWSAVPNGDKLEIAYTQVDETNMGYVQYDYASNSFTNETIVLAAGMSAFSNVCISLDDNTNDLYIFYLHWTGQDPPATKICYNERIAGVWSNSLDLVNDSIAGAFCISVSNIVENNKVSVLYNRAPGITGTLDFDVAFTYFTVGVSSSVQPSAQPTTSTDIDWFNLGGINSIWIILVIVIVIIAVFSSIKAKSPARQSHIEQSGDYPS